MAKDKIKPPIMKVLEETIKNINLNNIESLKTPIKHPNNKIKISTIEDLVHMLKQAKEENEPLPVFFLGAGVSKSGNIPLASEIQKDILEKYSNNPKIKNMDEKNKNYSKLMDCLTPFERNKLLKEYIKDAKINVAHIYLAQLLKEDYIDYILTVNFDNLMVRALALYNEFPPTYDIAILKDLTTTTISKKSVTYLHGQHHGLWLLNTKEEMEKVQETVPNIIHSIKDRPWIFIGYSGEDLIFNHIIKLGRFDKGLYWVGYKDNLPSSKVCNKLLEQVHTNATLIKGHDADSFMFELSKSLGLEQPNIINKPFTMLGEILNNIVDIEKDGVNKRLITVKNNVGESIEKFENDNFNKIKIEIYNLKKNKEFENNKDQILEIEKKVIESTNKELDNLLASLYFEWAEITLNSLEQKIKLYDKAIQLDDNYVAAYCERASAKDNLEKYEEAISDLNKAIELNPNSSTTYYNKGIANSNLKKHEEAILNYSKTIELDLDHIGAYSNRGIANTHLKKYESAILDFNKVIELDPNNALAYGGRGVIKAFSGKYKEAISDYNKEIELNPNDKRAIENRRIAKKKLSQFKNK
jgi:tetratricopeptide (TPR) repeat protein